MNDVIQRHKALVSVAILLVTMALSAGILVLGYEQPVTVAPTIAVGEESPERFVANATTEIEDPVKTQEARDQAAFNEPAPFTINQTTTQSVLTGIGVFFADLAEGAFLPVSTTTTTTLDDTPTTSPTETTTTSSTTTTVPETTTTTIPRRDAEDQVELLMRDYEILTEETVAQFVALYDSDLDRVAAGDASVFPQMQSTALSWAEDELTDGIRDADLAAVRSKYLNSTTRPAISIVGLPEAEVSDASDALASLVARQLTANEFVDETAWEQARQAARDAVPVQKTTFAFGDIIADAGDILTSVQVAAIQDLELYEADIKPSVSAWVMALFGALSVLLAAFLLFRIAPNHFDRARDVALLAVIIVLAAVVSRVPDVITSADNHTIGYVMPAVAIGVMASILFDQRIALLLAIPVVAFTAVSSGDLAFTIYAGVAAAVPVAFVSAVSSRSQLRLSVLGSGAVAAPIAGAAELLFVSGATGGDALEAVGWALGGAIVGGFLGQGIVSFLETAFGVTTTMSLLDLLDRNHPALQVLEEKAPGTFNHSMLVGSLAGRAARAIDADPLLAQAAAWYHDLGKTENPQYFVENQLGYNPHDELKPEESVEIIRKHVIDGLSLAKQYRIPDGVADGIRMHHGTSLIRYFYHRALKDDEKVDPEIFRHHGSKPTGREMAIVMISDATEAAARAYAQAEQPTEAGLRKLVDGIVSEKLEDGQFEECALTFGELTIIKSEVVAALSAYYHARVEYPDFPEPPVTPAA
jgi:hypothetical protein